MRKTLYAMLLFALIFCFGGFLGLANATVVTLQPPEADTEISERFPGLNFGSGSSFDVLVANVGGIDYVYRSLVRFDLSSIPAGSTINSATLTLYCNSVNPGADSYDYTVYRATFDWAESTVTWDSVSGGQWSTHNSATITGIHLNQFVTWTVTGIVRDWIQNGATNQGFIIVIQATSGSNGGGFASKEYAAQYEAERAPALQVDYGPAPAQQPGPVGGTILPAEKIGVLAPYLALIGFVVGLSVFCIVKRSRKD